MIWWDYISCIGIRLTRSQIGEGTANVELHGESGSDTLVRCCSVAGGR